ncbi:MAG: tetratricopeptide repeat protein [Phycisphaerales bacterium]|nr:tetratricopeptide repeat protein [Phycisphaerales bacterium]
MAAKVNTKFVVILSLGVLVLVMGVVALAAVSMLKSGERFVKQGDEYVAQGKFREAAQMYERAVGKDRTNRAWITKWRDSLKQAVFTEPKEQVRQYNFYVRLLEQIATQTPTDPTPQLEYLSELNTQMRGLFGGGRQALEEIIKAVDERTSRLDPAAKETRKILRYRGLARLDRLALVPSTAEEREQILKDLQGAAEADPSDWEVVFSIARWHLFESGEFDKANRPDQAENQRRLAAETLDKVLAAQPDQPEVLLFRFQLKQREALTKATSNLERREAARSLAPDLRTLLAAVEKNEPAKLRPGTLLALIGLAAQTDPKEGPARVEALMEKVAAAKPDDAEALFAYGRAAVIRRDWPQADARFRKILSLADKPVAEEGWMLPGFRRAATAQIADTAIFRAEAVREPGERAKAMAEARARIDDLQKITDVDTEAELKLRQARLALIEGRFDQAAADFEALMRLPGSNRSELGLQLAGALRGQGNLGGAKDLLDRVIQEGFGSAEVLAQRGAVLQQMGRGEEAIRDLQAAADLDPENTGVRETLATLKAAGGKTDGDPVISGLIAAQRRMTDGDMPGARQAMGALMKAHPTDTRILRTLIQWENSAGNRAEALKLIDDAIAGGVDKEFMTKLKPVLQIENPLDRQLAVLDLTAGMTEMDRLMARHQLLAQGGRAEEAARVLDQAEKVDPDNRMVIEQRFQEALRAKNNDRARELAARAAKLNSDQVGGLTYQGRIQLAEERWSDAVTTFAQAVQRAEFNPGVRRFLAIAQLRDGKIEQGVENFRRAVKERPGEVEWVREFTRVLADIGRACEALPVLSPEKGGILGMGRGDDQIVEMWLVLEEQCGDKAKVAKIRQELFARNPKVTSNTLALYRAAMSSQNFAEAEKYLKALGEAGELEPLALARLRAEWHANQGKFDDGAKAFRDAIAAGPKDKPGPFPWIALAEYLAEVSQFEEKYFGQSLEAYAEAAKLQDPKIRESDRSKADLFFNLGTGARTRFIQASTVRDEAAGAAARKRMDESFEQARQGYQAIVDAGADDERLSVAKRLVETLMNLQKFDDAAKTLAPVKAKQPAALDVMMLGAALADQRKDRPAQMKILDEAVSTHPLAASVRLERARVLMMDTARFNDALADVNKALEIQPGNTGAWQMLFRMYAVRGDRDEAVAQLRKGVTANPENDQLRQLLVQALREFERPREAWSEVSEAVKKRPEDPLWLGLAAGIAREQSMFRESADMAGRLFKIQPTIDNRGAYLHVLLQRGEPRPDRREVQEHLSALEAHQPQEMGVVLLRARAQSFLGKQKEALKLLGDALEMARKDWAMQLGWFENASLILKGDEFRTFIADVEKKAPLPPLMKIAAVNTFYSLGDKPADLLKQLDGLDEQVKDTPRALFELNRARGQLHYELKQHEKAIESYKRALEANASDYGTNNNIAYILAKELGKPEEALAFAERAAQLRPRSAAVLDTLGWVQFRTGKLDDADRTLQNAIRVVETDDRGRERVEQALPPRIHLGMVRVAQGNKDDARRLLREAEERFKAAPENVRAMYTDDLESLRKSLQ